MNKKLIDTDLLKKRNSKRKYPPAICIKPDCGATFIPTDGKQKYCCAQHRIDHNNDKRKVKAEADVDFLKSVKQNREILKKIEAKAFYRNNNQLNLSLLEYEGYQFEVFHRKAINNETNGEVFVCYDYGIECIDAINQTYKIYQTKK